MYFKEEDKIFKQEKEKEKNGKNQENGAEISKEQHKVFY